MKALFATCLAVCALAACSVNPSGHCARDTDCTAAASTPPPTCDTTRSPPVCVVPQGACVPACQSFEACVAGACVAQGPQVKQVTAPLIYSPRTGTVTVTAVIDDTSGPGLGSAALHIAGKQDVAGTLTSSVGAVGTYSFAVPATVQAVGSDTPIDFTVSGTDKTDHTTPTAAFGTGQLFIDDKAPSLSAGVTVNGGTTAGGIQWFKSATTGDIDVQTTVVDTGSGVDPTTLMLMDGSTRLDHGTPACAAGATAQALVCHFTVALSYVPAGSQRKIVFAVAGADKVGKTLPTNTASVGIDGKAPSITFSIGNAGDTTKTTNYPVNFADCNGGVVDPTVFCGHDGSHFWRAGDGKYKFTFTVTDTFIAPDDVGSGVDLAGGTCTIAGSSTTCAVTYDAVSGKFSFPANFATATFTSGADGTETVSVTANAKDIVGNTATAVTLPINVTRVKWMRSMAGKINKFKASPVFTTHPVAQLVVAGTEVDTLGPIASVSPDGSSLWRAGHLDVDTIVANVAYSSASNSLYVTADQSTINNNKMFAYHIGATGSDGGYNCTLLAGTPGKVSGSPAILTDTSREYVLVSDQTLHRLWAFTGVSGTGCDTGLSTSTTGGGLWTGVINPPSVKGSTNTVYVAHGTSSLAAVPFSGGSFGTVQEAASFTIPVLSQVAIATNLFFGDRNALGKYYSYTSTDLTSLWASPALADALLSSPVVSAVYVFGVAASGDGKLRAFSKGDGTLVFSFPGGAPTANQLGNLSAPALGANNVIYLSGDSPPALYAATYTTGTAADFAPGWGQTLAAAYQGSAATTPDSTLDSLTTEPTLDASGTIYFGTLAGKVYALITDSAGPLPPVAGTTWPRVGYDNCNSSNTGFSCQ